MLWFATLYLHMVDFVCRLHETLCSSRRTDRDCAASAARVSRRTATQQRAPHGACRSRCSSRWCSMSSTTGCVLAASAVGGLMRMWRLVSLSLSGVHLVAVQFWSLQHSDMHMTQADVSCCPRAQVFVMKELKQLANSKKENAVEGAPLQLTLLLRLSTRHACDDIERLSRHMRIALTAQRICSTLLRMQAFCFCSMC